MGLEIPTGKTPGTEIRRTKAPEPAIVGSMILGFTALIFVFAGLVFSAVYDIEEGVPVIAHLSSSTHDPAIPECTIPIGFPTGFTSPSQWSIDQCGIHMLEWFSFKDIHFWTSEQVMVSFWLACMMFCLYMVIFLYQRFFMDHVTIAKKRFRKWEDEGVQLK